MTTNTQTPMADAVAQGDTELIKQEVVGRMSHVINEYVTAKKDIIKESYGERLITPGDQGK